MAISFATITPADMDIGPCQVTYDGVDLGGTLDNVVVSFKYIKTPLTADQTGPTILDEAVSGMEVTVTTSLAEVRNKVNMAKVLPNMDLTGTGATALLDMKNKVATRQLQYAKALILHPLAEASGTSGEDQNFHFYKAVPSEESEITFDAAGQRKLKVVWKIYLDTASGAKMFRWGDKDT